MEECTYEVGGIPLAGWNTPDNVEDCTYEVGGIPLLLQKLWKSVPMRWVEYPCSCRSSGRVEECAYEVGGIPLTAGGRLYTYEVGGIPLLLQKLWQDGRVYL